MATEQRKYKRYLPSTTTIAALGKENMKVGIIKDISASGLSFKVTSDDGSPLGIMPTVDIFKADHGFRLKGVPCTIIYCKHRMPVDGESAASAPFSCSRYGLRFDRLSKDQVAQLVDFFKNNATALM